MSIFNSSDDSDITIINPSISQDNTDEYVPIITRLKQANHSSQSRQVTNPVTNKTNIHNDNAEYVFIDHNPSQAVQQLEKALQSYITDLKQETLTEFNCAQQLVIRLMDVIAPIYAKDPQKLKELETMKQEIASLHDRRYMEQQEKLEQLKIEISQLNKQFITSTSESLKSNQAYSLVNPERQKYSFQNDEQWTEIEEDTKKLHEIIESQKNQINEIVNLISEAVASSNTIDPDDSPIISPKDANNDVEPKPKPTNFINTFLQRLQNIAIQHTQTASISSETPRTEILENHSPGLSPSQSLSTLVSAALHINPTNLSAEPPAVSQEQTENHDPTPILLNPPVDVPVAVVHPQKEPKHCPICNQEFLSTASDDEVYEHVEHCLLQPSSSTEPKDFQCPKCNRTFPHTEESSYLRHMSDCYNHDF